jgi:hypothetical protein
LSSLDFQKLAPDLCNALSLTKQKKQQAAQEGKMKKQSKRGKKVAGITSAQSTLYLYFVTPSDSVGTFLTWLININII